MLSQIVVLFTFSVIQSMSEQFKCEVIPFETNDVRGTCCIHLKNNFRRPSKEEIDRQILENVFERRNQATPENDQRHFGKNGQNRNGEFGNRPKTYPVTENVNGYGSTSRRVPFIEHIDSSRATERNPILFEDTNHMNSDRRVYNEYNRGSSVDTGFNSRADESLNTNTKFKIRPLPDNVRNENPKSSTATEKTFSQIEKSYNQKKVDRINIFQGKNESNSNFINRTKGDDEHVKPKSNNTIPDLGNRNNVNVPDTCTEGYARNANGKCVKIFQ